MNRTAALALAAGLALAALSPFEAPVAGAHDVMVGDLMLIHPTARPNMPNRPTAAYIVIANDGETPDRLIAASSSAFEAAELHTVIKDGDVMKMQPVEAIEIPAGEAVELAPGGYHIMLFGAVRLFKPGDRLPLVLTFEKAGDVTIDAMVEKVDPSQMQHGQMGQGHTSN
jgi:copper(I)-binding protein